MIVGINCGHTISGAGYGAAGIIKESEHTRLVGQALMGLLHDAGITVVDCTINQANTQNEYLAAAVAFANMVLLDMFISIHFNASGNHEGNGTEVYTYAGIEHQEALNVCANLNKLGFKNRGVKDGSGLYVIKNTKARAMLIEVCFCDNQHDVELYESAGVQKVAEAICSALCKDNATEKHQGETAIMGSSIATAEQLNALLLYMNPQAVGYEHLAKIFIEEGEKEGVRGDGAFCQSLIETGYFKFGGDVHPDQNNYAGLGATGGVSGLSFPDDKTGVRAQIQHLKAYASTEALCQECVDIRYKYVKKGCAPTFEQLSGKWAVPGYSGYPSLEAARAAKDSYGDHIAELLDNATKIVVATSQPDVDETAPEGALFVVQVGAYKSLNNAKKLQKSLEAKGIISMINQYKVAE